MALIVTGYVDGEPVFFESPEPDQYEAAAEIEEKAQYEVEISAEDEYGNVGQMHSLYYVAGAWIEPVWQRTKADVEYAAYLNDKIGRSGWNSLTSQEQSAWAAGLTGCLNYWDLNRIEQDVGYLSDMLNGYGYTQEILCKTDWAMTDFPRVSEVERIRSNVQTLIDAYCAQTVALPDTLESPDYQVINDLENVLRLMQEMIHRMEESFRRCGPTLCGQGVVL
jgi:hypothetical protein